MDIAYPMLFELRNPSDGKVSHCGVQEFTADLGNIYMPKWVCHFIFFLVQPSFITLFQRLIKQLLYVA